jgi:hypothetical protein
MVGEKCGVHAYRFFVAGHPARIIGELTTMVMG